MKRIATGIAFALMLAPVWAHAEEKSTTTTTSSSDQTKAATKDTQKTAGNPMNTPDTEKSATTSTADKSASSGAMDKSSSSASAADEKMTDARLVTLLQKVNKEEIEAGKLAQKRGKSAAIRNFGKTLIADHTKSQKEVSAAAKKAKISPSDSALTMKDKEQEKVDKNKMDQLKKLSGAEFDKTFAQVMSKDHEHMISLLKDHKDDLQSDDLKTLVDNTIPVLEQHKDLADKAMSQESRASSESSQGSSSAQGRSSPSLDRSPSSSGSSTVRTPSSSDHASPSDNSSSHPSTGDDSAKSGSSTSPDKK